MTDCLDDEAIANLSAGVLDEHERAALTAHIDVCPACRVLVADAAPSHDHADGAEAPRGDAVAPGYAAAMIGETLDRKYEIVGLLGEGGMGSVYEARHRGTSRRVAVKLIRPDKLAPGGTAQRRFRREARAAGAIQSPHIVEILDAGTDDATGNLYLVMEYLAGEDLKSLLDRTGPLPYDVALRIAGQALVGLTKAHAAGVVHRDIKPANLFLARQDEGGVVMKVLDFGVAKLRRDPLRDADTLGLTDTGGFLGSPVYMSPEQVQNSKDVDARTDVWSMGCVLYAAIAGHAPHQHIESLGRLVLAICGTPAPPLRDVVPGVPEEVAALVHRALAIDPAERPPNAAAMLEAIRALLPGGLALREEMLPDRWPAARPQSRARAAEDVSTTLADVTTGGTETSNTARRTRRRALPVLTTVLALGIGGTLGYLLTRPAAPVARASPSSTSPAQVSAPALPGASARATGAPESRHPAGERTAPATAPPSATAPRGRERPAVAKDGLAPVVSPPRAPVAASAKTATPPASAQTGADPLIPVDPP